MFRKCYLLLFLVLLYSGSLFSQGSVKFGVGGGFTFLLGSENYTDDIDTTGTRYGFNSNYHFGARIKAQIMGSPLRITGLINYTSLSGENQNVIVNSSLGQPIAADFETDGSIFTVAAGAEYLFLPGPINPYALLNLQLNSIGDFTFTRNSSEGEVETTIQGGTRFGVGLGAGINFSIVPQFDIDVNATLNLYNITGKERGENSITGLNLTLNLLYNVF